jgi:MFS family permease
MYWLTLSSLLLVTGAVNLQVPLYQHYAEISGASHTVSALAFATYVAGLVPILLLFAGASDRLGRKPIVMLALLCSLAATVLMAVFPSMEGLFVARVLQGMGVGLGMGTVTAYLSEQRPGAEKAVSAHVALASSLGFGGGALFTTASLMLLDTSLPLSFVVATIALAIVLAAMPLAPVTARSQGGALTRLPKFLPRSAAPYLAICAAWSISGLVIALLPAQLAKHQLASWAGPALFLVNVVGIVCQPMARKFSSRVNLAIGAILIPLGYGIMVRGANEGSVPLLLVGASVAGAACYGFTYLGGLTHIVEHSGSEKARSVSGYFLFAYFGFAAPSIVMGMVADKTSIAAALEMFGYGIVLVHVLLLLMIFSPSKLAPLLRRGAQ